MGLFTPHVYRHPGLINITTGGSAPPASSPSVVKNNLYTKVNVDNFLEVIDETRDTHTLTDMPLQSLRLSLFRLAHAASADMSDMPLHSARLSV